MCVSFFKILPNRLTLLALKVMYCIFVYDSHLGMYLEGNYLEVEILFSEISGVIYRKFSLLLFTLVRKRLFANEGMNICHISETAQ